MDKITQIINRIVAFWVGRSRNVQTYVRIVLQASTPVITYMGLTGQDITNWANLAHAFGEFFASPYLVGLFLIGLYQSFVSTQKKEPQNDVS